MLTRSAGGRAALLLALAGCGNSPPQVQIVAPTFGEELTDRAPVRWIAVVTDPDGPDDLRRWRWEDGSAQVLGEGLVPADGIVAGASLLAAGEHTLAVTVTDSAGNSTVETLTFDVTTGTRSPTALIVAPSPDALLLVGEETLLRGQVVDGDGPIEDLSVTWVVEVSPGSLETVGSGHDEAGRTTASWTPTTAGPFTVGLSAKDADGHVTLVSVPVQAVASRDADGDGDGVTPRQGDCDDTDADVHPAALERCGDARDEDCTGAADDADRDADGHVDAACAPTTTSALPADDCDDLDAARAPGVPELEDGIDQDCDGWRDDGTPAFDDDGDCACPGATCVDGRDDACAALLPGDCDDADTDLHPANPERCDGLDQNCDGVADEGLEAAVAWPDADGDGHGDGAAPGVFVCGLLPGGTSTVDDDCDDTLPEVHGGQPEVGCNTLDDDCDPATLDAPDLDADGVDACTDCDDLDPARFPGNPEVCNTVDDDCSGVADDGLAAVVTYVDADGDGFGSVLSPATGCGGPGTSPVPGDCDDAEADVHPGAVEIACDGRDDDCDLGTPDGVDADGDGVRSCSDCDDADPFNFPLNPELCDGADNDCDLQVDEAVVDRDVWPDTDGDGHGDLAATPTPSCARLAPGTSWAGDDCDDTDVDKFPGNPERCDGADQDCDALVDDGALLVGWWPDADGDGRGDAAASPIVTCDGPPVAGAVADGTDCDDTDEDVHPGADEVPCNGVDDDCLLQSDDDADQDLDGVGACLDCDDGDATNTPGATELCDGTDDDCDGIADDGLPTVGTWPDADGDGFGDAAEPSVPTCSTPAQGRVTNAGDCDDDDWFKNPGLTEVVCDGVENDCSVATSDAPDTDADGATTCDDCDDGDPTVAPGRAEVCDGLDQDCDGAVDEGLAGCGDACFVDADGDGAGGPMPVVGAPGCSAPGQSGSSDDCDDADPDAFPGNVEHCDGVDNDCADGVDEDVVVSDRWPDLDGDGFGDDSALATSSCDAPGALEAGVAGDCDDADAAVSPGTAERECNGVDDDCDPATPDSEGPAGDADGDGFEVCDGDCDDGDPLVYPGADDAPDGAFVDADCDGYDGAVGEAVFVSVVGSDVGNDRCGFDDPCRTIDHAVEVADARGKSQLWLSAGTYDRGATLTHPVALVGGFDAAWARAPLGTPGHDVVLTGGFFADDGEYETVRVRTTAAALVDLRVLGPDAAGVTASGDGRSTYAVHADEGATVVLERCEVVAGRAADGLDGADGADAPQSAAPAGDGLAGAAGRAAGACDDGVPLAGAGGVGACAATAGGDGGDGGAADGTCCVGGCDDTCGECFGGDAAAGVAGAQGFTAPVQALWLREVDAALDPVGPVLELDWFDSVSRLAPDVTALPDGYAVAWGEQHGTDQDGDTRLRIATFRGPGRTLGFERTLRTAVVERPELTANDAGQLFVTWNEYLSDTDSTVWTAGLDADGAVLLPPAVLPGHARAEYVVTEFLGDDHVVLVYEAPRSATDPVDAVWLTVLDFPTGAVWVPPFVLSDAPNAAERPALAVTDGAPGWRVAVSWEQLELGLRTVHGTVVTVSP
jgi:hypothetical protein